METTKDERGRIEKVGDSGEGTIDGLTVVNGGTFEWKLETVDCDRIQSPMFEFGDSRWQLILHLGQDGVSLFLARVREEDTSMDAVCLHFDLLLCQNGDSVGTPLVSKTASHRYPARGTWNTTTDDWGFVSFCRGTVNAPAVFRVEMRLVADPVGNLWIDPTVHSSRAECGYVGLRNQGATCYMNSLLQSLFLISYFRKTVYAIPTDPGSVAYALQRLFVEMETNDDAVSTRDLTRSFGWTTIESFYQRDVQEFSRILMDALEKRMKGTSVEGALDYLFRGEGIRYVECVNVDYTSTTKETFYDIPLPVKGSVSLDAAFDALVVSEALTGENQYLAEGHGLQDAKLGFRFKSLPRVLHLQLKRFEYDYVRDAVCKVNDRWEYPVVIDLGRFLEDNSVTGKFHLYAVLVHAGDVGGGHYYAFLRDYASGKWVKFDDDIVTWVSEREAVADNYGGGGRGRGIANAYMLVYVREDSLEEMLGPVPSGCVPRNLISGGKVEIRALTLDYLRETSTGSGLNVGEVPRLVLDCGSTVSIFLDYIEEQHGIPHDCVRVWRVGNGGRWGVLGGEHVLSSEELVYLEIADDPIETKGDEVLWLVKEAKLRGNERKGSFGDYEVRKDFVERIGASIGVVDAFVISGDGENSVLAEYSKEKYVLLLESWSGGIRKMGDTGADGLKGVGGRAGLLIIVEKSVFPIVESFYDVLDRYSLRVTLMEKGGNGWFEFGLLEPGFTRLKDVAMLLVEALGLSSGVVGCVRLWRHGVALGSGSGQEILRYDEEFEYEILDEKIEDIERKESVDVYVARPWLKDRVVDTIHVNNVDTETVLETLRRKKSKLVDEIDKATLKHAAILGRSSSEAGIVSVWVSEDGSDVWKERPDCRAALYLEPRFSGVVYVKVIHVRPGGGGVFGVPFFFGMRSGENVGAALRRMAKTGCGVSEFDVSRGSVCLWVRRKGEGQSDVALDENRDLDACIRGMGFDIEHDLLAMEHPDKGAGVVRRVNDGTPSEDALRIRA